MLAPRDLINISAKHNLQRMHGIAPGRLCLAYPLQLASSAIELCDGLGCELIVIALKIKSGVFFMHKLFSLTCSVVSCEHS